MELFFPEYTHANRFHPFAVEPDIDGVLMGSFFEAIQCSCKPLNLKVIWWAVTGSNCGPPACKALAA